MPSPASSAPSDPFIWRATPSRWWRTVSPCGPCARSSKQPFDVPGKKFLIELGDVLYARLFDLPAERLAAVADALGRSISAGDVQLWFRNGKRQALVAGTQAAGALPRPDGDFLMLVDGNLTASKANLELTKQVDYQVERRADGRLVGHVRVELRNDGAPGPINRSTTPTCCLRSGTSFAGDELRRTAARATAHRGQGRAVAARAPSGEAGDHRLLAAFGPGRDWPTRGWNSTSTTCGRCRSSPTY